MKSSQGNSTKATRASVDPKEPISTAYHGVSGGDRRLQQDSSGRGNVGSNYHRSGACQNCGQMVHCARVGSNTTWPENLTEAQLEELLAECRLHHEQGLLEDDSGRMHAVTTTTCWISDLVGPTDLLDVVEIEGVHIEAVVDTGSQYMP